jgi:hypothetical protein
MTQQVLKTSLDKEFFGGKGIVLALEVEKNLRKDQFEAIEHRDIGLISQITTEIESLDFLIEQAYRTFIKFHVSRNIDHWDDEIPS